MLGFCCLAPLGDSLAKVLGETIPIPMLVFIRFAVQAAVLFPLIWAVGQPVRLPSGTAKLILLRTVLHIIGIGCMFSALQYLPLADAIAIAFVMPFIMLLLGHYILGEEVGRHRLIACAVGFVGTLLVIQPNFAEVGLPALLPLVVAVVFALFMLVTRKIAKTIGAVPLQAISGLQASLMLLPVLFLMPQAPDITAIRGDIWLLLALGLLGTLAHLLMTWSLRFAPSATLAPMQYLEIPIGTLIGWWVFQDLPNGLAALGIVITMASGLYIILRERRLSQHPKSTAAT
jgi:drug/metabolite transporter (DMT)-like permease